MPKKTPYAHVAIHWEQDEMLDSIAYFTNKSKMELVEMFVKSAHKALAYNFKKLGVESLKMSFNIAINCTIAPMPEISGIIEGVPMDITEEEHEKLVSDKVKGKIRAMEREERKNVK